MIAQEKKLFLQTRFNGFTETITKDFTQKNLEELKNILERQGLFFSYKNLKYNKSKEIIKITIKVKNKRNNSEVTFDDKEKPIPNIKVGEVNGIVFIEVKSTLDLKPNKFITKYKSRNNTPIYIVDGKIISYSKVINISTDSIEFISVLKGKSAIKKYGEKGKSGVILIKTKKK
tara:strand:+ start:224 stop:745 length:522 start_codon:yes stop_codon:yes gene_type:complete